MTLRTPICEQFGIEAPIFLAGMGGVAYAKVCAAVSEAGGFGTLGMAGESPEGIREEMQEVRRLTDKPFGVDLLAALPEQMMDAIDTIIEEGASAFIAGLGVPEAVIQKCHEGGVKVMSMCGKVRHAVAAERAGCDVVVAQGTEAGGHTGQIAGMALIPQTVDAVSIPVLGAGSIVDGRGLAAAHPGPGFRAGRRLHGRPPGSGRMAGAAGCPHHLHDGDRDPGEQPPQADRAFGSRRG